MIQIIIILSWTILILYWWLKAQWVSPTREARRTFRGIWLYSGLFFFGFLLLTNFVSFSIFPFTVAFAASPTILQLIAGIFVVLGAAIAIWARQTLSKNWSGNVVINQDHELITYGVYRLVRHPIYSGILMMSSGTFLFTLRISAIVFFAVMLLFLRFKLKEEEDLLIRHFPDQYPEYKQNVKAIIPLLW